MLIWPTGASDSCDMFNEHFLMSLCQKQTAESCHQFRPKQRNTSQLEAVDTKHEPAVEWYCWWHSSPPSWPCAPAPSGGEGPAGRSGSPSASSPHWSPCVTSLCSWSPTAWPHCSESVRVHVTTRQKYLVSLVKLVSILRIFNYNFMKVNLILYVLLCNLK